MDRPADALATLEAVSVRREGGTALDAVSATIPASGITVVAGPSGAGKTTLLRLLNRLDVPDAGVVRWRGRDVATIPARELRRRVGMVFQRPVALPGTVADNLRVGEPGLTDDTVRALLARCALDPALASRQASELSGGEAQRMCLARALAVGPEALLADEPTASVDPATRGVLEALARDLADAGTPLVWVTHDLAQLRRLADHVLVLRAGRVLAAGAAAAVLDERQAPPGLAAFLAGRLAGEEGPGAPPADPASEDQG